MTTRNDGCTRTRGSNAWGPGRLDTASAAELGQRLLPVEDLRATHFFGDFVRHHDLEGMMSLNDKTSVRRQADQWPAGANTRKRWPSGSVATKV